MKDWIPLPGSAKGRLALAALEEFGARGYEAVSVTELAAKAGVTTGSLYHHFNGKIGLYQVARQEAERRLLDRMRGAAAARAVDRGGAALTWALLVGLDSACDHGTVALLAEAPTGDDDPVEDFLATLVPSSAGPIAARVLAAAWRAALTAITQGTPVEHARTALTCLHIHEQQRTDRHGSA